MMIMEKITANYEAPPNDCIFAIFNVDKIIAGNTTYVTKAVLVIFGYKLKY